MLQKICGNWMLDQKVGPKLCFGVGVLKRKLDVVASAWFLASDEPSERVCCLEACIDVVSGWKLQQSLRI
jgi:hypothetical protein